MRRGLMIGSGTTTVLVLVVVGCSPQGTSVGTPTTTATRVSADPSDTGTKGRPKPVTELRGTGAWRLSRPATQRQIEGYPTATSGVAGTDVTLRVSTSARSYRVEAYRVGGYRHAAGRLVWRSGRLPGRLQAPARVDARTHQVTAPWSDSVTIGTRGWADGFYLFKLVARSGWQAHAPYVVSSRSVAGRVVLMAPSVTWQAYNDWGGFSLYTGSGSARRAWAVAFDRPYPAPGAGRMSYDVVPAVATMEKWGLPLAYLADVDLDRRTEVLAGARALVSLGHDEYWTRSRVRAVLRARAAGTNLAFLGANTMYWKVRLGASENGPRRVVVGYRTDAGSDPLRGTRAATGLWRDQGQVESTVTGVQYECYPVDEPFTVVSPSWWGFRGTGVRHGTRFEHLVGIETDRVYPDDRTPRPLQILAHTPYSCLGAATSSQAVYYTTPSGAGVFTAGTLRWACALTGRCGQPDVDRATVRFVRRVTRTILRVFADGPAGHRRPANDNVAAFDLPTVNSVPPS